MSWHLKIVLIVLIVVLIIVLIVLHPILAIFVVYGEGANVVVVVSGWFYEHPYCTDSDYTVSLSSDKCT